MNKLEIREAAETDLIFFINLVAPHRVWGMIHKDVVDWWCREGAKSHQLLLLPRGHQKSTLVAYRVAWEITRRPDVTILYISSTSGLAEQQLRLIKSILTSKNYRRYWPEMVHEQEGKREIWNTSEIAVDHPKRKSEGVRDATVFTGGLTTSLTGFHCDIAVLDDVVVQENAYTDEGRNRVKTQYSLLSSIENPGALEWVVGTRYHPSDLYQDLIEMEEEKYNDKGELYGSVPVFEVLQREVEDAGDGTGEFIWPRQQRTDGRWFGFDTSILMKKKAQYLDVTQYYAQYYNNPNDPTSAFISSDKFQYYDKGHLNYSEGAWYYKDRKLNVYASIDFAFSMTKRSDYTAIVVIGIDASSNIYVLDIHRFKTDKTSEYFKEIRDLYIKWDFKKLRAETTAAQRVVVRELREQYFKPNGLLIKVDEFNPTRKQGSKDERIMAVLEPRYDNQMIWHYKGGHCQTLEEELIAKHPPHDDVKDALAAAIDIAVPPKDRGYKPLIASNVVYHTRFGGIA